MSQVLLVSGAVQKAIKIAEKQYLARLNRSATARWNSLTDKQKQVAKDLLTGVTSADIAEHLGISERTLQRHRQNVFHKLGIRKTADLTTFRIQLQQETGNFP